MPRNAAVRPRLNHEAAVGTGEHVDAVQQIERPPGALVVESAGEVARFGRPSDPVGS
jgi:hypothetical protein